MKVVCNGEEYEVVVEKKKTNKNIYLRIKEDYRIVITCGPFTTEEEIKNVLIRNEDNIIRMILKNKRRRERASSFYLLGKKYEVVSTDSCDIMLGKEKVFLNPNFDLDKWKKKQALALFQEHLEKAYQNFSRKIPKPTLRLRKMKTRWGVCNTKTHVITLNTELITYDIGCLDYVIYHELSHLVEANHSKKFWQVVEENCKDYKKYRDMLDD